MYVSMIMRHSAITLQECDSLDTAARIMLENDLRGVCVVNERNTISGFLSVSDFMAQSKSFPFSTFHAPQLFGTWLSHEGVEKIYKEARTKLVKEIMSSSFMTVAADDSVETVIEMMLDQNLNCIPVIQDNLPVGIIEQYDLLRLIVQNKFQVNHN